MSFKWKGWSGEIAQLVRYLSHKHEDLNLTPRIQRKGQAGMEVCIWSFSIRKETKGSLELVGQKAWPSWWVPSQWKIPSQKEDSFSEDDSWCCSLASRCVSVKATIHWDAVRDHLRITLIMVFCYIVLFSYWFVNLLLCILDKVYPWSICIRENICIGLSTIHSLKFPKKSSFDKGRVFKDV